MSELELFQIRQSQKLHDGCPEHKAIMALTRYYYTHFFLKEYKRVELYSKTPMIDDKNGELLGHKVLYSEDGSRDGVVEILLGQRCPRDSCCSNDIQCIHELVVDKDFILDK